MDPIVGPTSGATRRPLRRQVGALRGARRIPGPIGRPGAHTRPDRVNVDGQAYLQAVTAAAELGITRGRVYQLITGQRFRKVSVGQLLYVREADVRAYRIYQAELKRLHEAFRPVEAAAS